MTDQEMLKFLRTYGYFSAVAPDLKPQEIDLLTFSDSVAREALAKYQDFDTLNVDIESIRHHGRHVMADGEPGPATAAAMQKPRCGFPDFNPPGEMMVVGEATGSGNWKGCHGVGNFHAAVCSMNMSGIDPKWQEVWKDVLILTQKINAEMGLLWRFVENGIDAINGEDLRDHHVDTELVFVKSAPGWIGLAIVGTGMQCKERTIWLKLLTTYGRNYAREQRIWQLTSLLAHELTHNEGWSHDGRSMIQAPAIQTHSSPPSWIGDSMEGAKRRAYGGEAVPIPGGPDEPDPEPPPSPEDPLVKRVLELERRQTQDNITNAYQSAMLEWHGNRITKLEKKR